MASVAIVTAAPPAPRRVPRQLGLLLLGIVLLGWWASYWAACLEKDRLKRSPRPWFPTYSFLGLDFLHNYHSARHWLAGGNPYLEKFGDPIGRKLCYPPIVLPFFAWCGLVENPRIAVALWTTALGGFAAAGGFAAWRSRNRLGLSAVPGPFAVGCVVASAPVMFAMERGNYDLLTVPPILVAAWALQRRSMGRDAVAGACLALATGFKVYPGLLILMLLPLGRGRAFLFAGAAGLACLTYQAENLPACVENLRELAAAHAPEKRDGVVSMAAHSVPMNWKLMWAGTRLHRLTQVPGSVAAFGLLAPLLAWVAVKLWRCPDPRAVVLPALLWAAAAATFAPQVSNDYNLFFLPMAAVAVWDRRDPVAVQVALGGMFVWAQPVAFPVSPDVVLAAKYAALVAVAACLSRRIEELSPRPEAADAR